LPLPYNTVNAVKICECVECVGQIDKQMGATMKAAWEKPAAAAVKKIITKTTARALSRRDLLAGSVGVGATVLLTKGPAAADREITFTILHTNDLHSKPDRHGPGPGLRPGQDQ
jgi:hypothetical protein